MKHCITVLLSLMFFASCTQEQLKSNKLIEGINPDSVQVFSPGFISTGLDERDAVFSPDGNLFLFSVKTPTGFAITMVKKVLNGWTGPEITTFSGVYTDIEPAFHPCGDLFYFVSNRPLPGENEAIGTTNIWFMEYKDGVFGKPQPLPGDVNGKGNVYYPSLTIDTTIYFTRRQADGSEAIWRAEWDGGRFEKSEMLPGTINSTNSQFNAFIDPDERYIIVPVYGRDDAIGGSDYYFSFRNEVGEWSNLIQPGKPINSEKFEYTPYITCDGKYFIFQSNRSLKVNKNLTYKDVKELNSLPGNGGSDLYITGTGFINKFKRNAVWNNQN